MDSWSAGLDFFLRRISFNEPLEMNFDHRTIESQLIPTTPQKI